MNLLPRLARLVGLAIALFVCIQTSSALAQEDFTKTYKGKIIVAAEAFPKKLDEELSKFLKTTAKKDNLYTAEGDGKSAWTVNLLAFLNKDPGGDSMMLVFYDRDDKESQKKLEPIQNVELASTKGNRIVSYPSLALSPDANFTAGKTYLLKITQLKGGKEVVLAEAQLTLATK